MIRKITVSGPRYRLQAAGSYKLVRGRTPQRSISVTHMLANTGGSGSDTIQMIAGVSLSALRAITADALGKAIYADNRISSTAGVIGITINAASNGDTVSIRDGNTVTDALWSFVPGMPVFLGEDGHLTQTAPGSDRIIVRVGVAVTATSMAIQVQQPIVQVS